MERYVGIDVGAETVKLAEVVREADSLRLVRHALVPHGKEPGPRVLELLRAWDWDSVSGAVATGRLGRQLALERIPTKQALLRGFRFLHGGEPATVVTIGSRGFSVLEIRSAGDPAYRESSRCAQGTGNFLRQLVERFGLTVEETALRTEAVEDPAPLSGRCPVILKTDMTHLANKGERQERILAGLLDAIAESAEVLVKPRRSPARVLLTGGVSRARRVREHFRAFLERNGMTLVDGDLDTSLVLEAVGCAVHAALTRAGARALPDLLRPFEAARIETVPALRTALGRVRRMPRPAPGANGAPHDVVLGFDIGSTGSKVVALDVERKEPLWEGYLRTGGNPVGAAQALMSAFLAGPAGGSRVRALGATGSGREIVGSLMATCYGPQSVFVLNEIAAHARGATHHDPRVDTIFEIGGQDAKYIRLEGGRIVDAAMNEACSAGTGSFIEEQGRRFEGVEDVAQLGRIAVESDGSAALGQHCSIFMAEVIDEAVAADLPRERIVAGLYESVIQNYLNRVKGSRSVGEVVFCQGMPFASDALAAAVARQTGAEVIVPPSPGTVGALGIALLATDQVAIGALPVLDGRRFLGAKVESKDTFVCRSVQGCGGGGNKCRIDRLTTQLEGDRRRFTWGGSCSLYDKGTRTRKLPDGAPHPFRERAELVASIAARLSPPRGGRRVSLTDDFQLKGMFPFFATFLHGLGLDLDVAEHADRAALKRGIEGANVPWCAPMQQYHGAVAALAERGTDLLFAPMIRETPRVASERASQLCPIVQGSPDVLRWDLGEPVRRRMLSPVIDVGDGSLAAPQLVESCRRLAAELGARGERSWRPAYEAARAAQLEFDARLLDLGRAALEGCARDGVVPVVVLGRTYTIHDDVLNSNLPAILRDQGAIAIPLDCFPVRPDAPVFENMYWGHGQRILRAAWQVRRTPGVYALFASNYSCGPDSFTHHLVQDLMDGKPFSVIETDGHAGDAGTKTRVEAYLHCVREHLAGGERRPPRRAERLTVRSATVAEIARSGERVLVPAMSDASAVFAAALRGMGIPAEDLPEPGAEALRLGRRHTSGKECLPMTLTLGSLLERLERAGEGERFAFFMPGADGPCRFGAYKEVHQLVLERLGFRDRVRIWAPPFGDYFKDVPPGLGAMVLAGTFATDLLRDMLHDVRPREARPGEADAAYRRYLGEVAAIAERATAGDVSGRRVLAEAASGRVWGLADVLARAGREFAALRGAADLPLVLVVGEIYLRNVASSNGNAVEVLERRGIRARVAGVAEFMQFSDFIGARKSKPGLGERIDRWVRRRIEAACHAAAAEPMGWHVPPQVREIVKAAGPWVRDALEGETVLTVGGAVHAWRRREVDGVVSIGPLECMPNKLAESQLVHVGEREELLSLTLSLNGDPIDPEPLDGFAIEVHARHRARRPQDQARPDAWGAPEPIPALEPEGLAS
ncbi:MAG TPA: BadF/BadG/BcrA/BcrD ATPase family protein [Anaeromyxobacter sp.]|nr:BadF/BadG/BcrA/BcrD ATPase family protein [Anaeromyxobacter sp.]